MHACMYMAELHEGDNLLQEGGGGPLTLKQTIPGECLLSIYDRPLC